MEKFIRELRAAKKRGVNVARVFVEVEEEIWLKRVKVFGLFLSILNVFITPPAIIALDMYCAIHNIKVVVPRDLAYWLCGMGFVSILAFGYDLIDLRRFLPKPPGTHDGIDAQSITLQLLPLEAADDDNDMRV